MSIVHQQATAADGSPGFELTTSAQFVQYHNIDRRQVGHLLGLPLDLNRGLPQWEHVPS